MLIIFSNSSSPGVFDIKSSLSERRVERIGLELSALLAGGSASSGSQITHCSRSGVDKAAVEAGTAATAAAAVPSVAGVLAGSLISPRFDEVFDEALE